MRRKLAWGLALIAAAARAALTVKTVRYAGTDAAQVMDVYTQGTGRSEPWVMILHGGGWAAGGKSQMVNASKKFAGQGYRVFNVEYRKVPGVAWASQLGDVNAALAYIHHHGTQFGINPDRGVMYGFSAGGQLAMSSGLSTTWIRGVISVSGVLQPQRVEAVADSDSTVGYGGDLPSQSIRTLSRWQAVAMGCPYITWMPECNARWNAFMPERRLSKGDPPLLLFQGSADITVPRGTLRGFRDRARRTIPDVTAWEKAGGPHNEVVAFDGGAHERMMYTWLATKTRPSTA